MNSYRDIITIDEDRCNGCGLCVPNCPEGALQIIDGKARLISDLFCDGLGACIGHCPEGAISTEHREAEPYDEKKVMENIVKHGENTIQAHLEHLKSHGAMDFYREAVAYLKEHGMEVPSEKTSFPAVHECPGSAISDFTETRTEEHHSPVTGEHRPTQLRQWPVQLTLVPVIAPYFNGAELVITADCVPFAYAGFHENFMTGKIVLVGCPKLDDALFYLKKMTAIFEENDIKSVTCLYMEVPCCFGLEKLVRAAIEESGKNIPLTNIEISIKGEVKTEQPASLHHS